MRRNIIIFLSILSVFVVSGCHKNGGNENTEPKEKALLLYMVANNNLYSYLEDNIEELVNNYTEDSYKNGDVYIYFKGTDSSTPPKLLKVVDNQTPETVINYDSHTSTSPEVVKKVIADFKSLANAEEYGVVFSSHATGWLPAGFTSVRSSSETLLELTVEELEISNPVYNQIRRIEYNPTTKAFGQDGTTWLEIEDLADALEDGGLDYILFDACYMGGIEVIYSLRNKADAMLAAPTEILSSGLNYNNIAQRLFADGSINDRLTAVAEDFVDKQIYSTVSVYDLSASSTFFDNYHTLMSAIEDKTANCTSSNVQTYDRYTNHVIFDLVDYIRVMNGDDSADQVEQWLEGLVVYKYADSYFINFRINSSSGVSTYIPFDSYTAVTPFYEQLDWYNIIKYTD